MGIEVYRCYDRRLRNFLMDNQVRFLVTAKDIKTDVQFWLFIKDERLVELLALWHQNSPKK
jgi:hypothetical protein